MFNILVKTSACVVALSSCLVLLFAYFVNTFYVNEEILNIPVLQSNQMPEKLLPEIKDKNKNELTFRILHGEKTKHDEKKLILLKNVNLNLFSVKNHFIWYYVKIKLYQIYITEILKWKKIFLMKIH